MLPWLPKSTTLQVGAYEETTKSSSGGDDDDEDWLPRLRTHLSEATTHTKTRV